MGQFFEHITVNPKDVQDLKEVLPLSIDQDEDFQRFVRLLKVKNNDPVAFFGDMETVGIKGSGCDPTYQEIGIANSQKRWALGDWQIPIKICYESLQGTIAEYTLKTGTQVGDLTDTEFMTYIFRPALERQMKLMIWRLAWFGDTEAKLIANGGSLTAGTKTELFTTCDGLFKRIFAQGTANSKQVTAILDDMLMDADSRITSDGDAIIMLTKGLADALTLDIKQRYTQIMPWEKVFDGVDVASYDGVTIARVSIWDRMIRAFENTGTKLNKPYRAVFANIRQLQVATDADGLISDIDVWFDKKERRNYSYSTGRIGTQILEDDMFHAAY